MVKLQVQPIGKPNLASMLGAAAQGVQGYSTAAAWIEEQKAKKRAELMQQQEMNLKQQSLQNQQDALGERIRFNNARLEQQDKAAQAKAQAATDKATAAANDRAGASAGLSSQLDSMYGGLSQDVPPDAGPLALDRYVPPEIKNEFATLRSALATGQISPEDAGAQMKSLGERAIGAVHGMMREELAAKLHDEAPFWNSMNAAGVQYDATGDGKPDPVSGVHEFLLSLIDKGYPPTAIAQLHQEIKQGFDQELARKVRRENTTAEFSTQLQAAQGTGQLPPEAHDLAFGVVQRFARGEYPDTAAGLQEAKDDMQSALAGKVNFTDPRTGARLSASPDEVQRHALGQRQAPMADALAPIKSLITTFSPVIGQFKFDPLVGGTEEEQQAAYMKRLKAVAKGFGVDVESYIAGKPSTPPAPMADMPAPKKRARFDQPGADQSAPADQQPIGQPAKAQKQPEAPLEPPKDAQPGAGISKLGTSAEEFVGKYYDLMRQQAGPADFADLFKQYGLNPAMLDQNDLALLSIPAGK